MIDGFVGVFFVGDGAAALVVSTFLLFNSAILVPSLSFDFTNSEKISDVSLVCGSKSGKECEIPCWGGRPIVIRPAGIFRDRLKL